MRFFGTPWKESITYEGGSIQWKEIGIEFVIPTGAIPEGEQVNLSVWPCTAGPFSLPEEYELASPVYQINPAYEFLHDITMTVHHFFSLTTAEQCDNMAFLSSPKVPYFVEQKSVYKFKVLSKGNFLPSQSYGSVSLGHFCNVSVGRKRKRSPGSRIISSGKKTKSKIIINFT